MLFIRYAYLSATSFKLKPNTLLYMSPRGLISILLFLQIGEVHEIPDGVQGRFASGTRQVHHLRLGIRRG